LQGDLERASLVDGALRRMVETQGKAVKAAVDLAASVLGFNDEWKIVLRKTSAIEHSLCGRLIYFKNGSSFQLIHGLQVAAAMAVGV
jgi:hypothetical protein